MPPWCNIVLPCPSFLALNNRTFQILFIRHYNSFVGEVKDYSRTHSALIMYPDPMMLPLSLLSLARGKNRSSYF
jgi:hypothetical protein